MSQATPSPASASRPPPSRRSSTSPSSRPSGPTNVWQWAAIVGLGLGPVGLAFYVWDIGVKHGDIQVLGAASYSAPLLSTAILVLTGYAAYSHTLLSPAC